MRKMDSLFKRTFLQGTLNGQIVDYRRCENEINPNCLWLYDTSKHRWATEKIDGSCCLIKNNKIYRRYDLKPGKILPKGAIPCQEKADPITGHFPHWLLCEKDNKQFDDNWYIQALEEQDEWEDGTYEIVGPHFSSNPYNLKKDKLIKHGSIKLDGVPFDYEGIKQYLHDNYIEGIVFYDEDGHMCKIKRTDFNFKWNQGGYIQTHTEKHKLIIDKGKQYITQELYNYSCVDLPNITREVSDKYNALKCLKEYIEELEHRCGVDSYVFIKDDSIFDNK